MSQLLSMSRVARLVGLPRGHLQRMAQNGELATFDGKVELAEVLRVFPDIKLDDDRELRRLEHIKDAAIAKSRDELPDANVLAERLYRLGLDHAAAQNRLRHYERVHGWIADRLGELVESNRLSATAAEEFANWLRRELAVPPGESGWERLAAEERVMRILSAQVTILPKGHVFEVMGDETLLEAGLHAGLNLPYGCANGNCGACKARVVRGEVTKVRPHDFVLSQAEKAQGCTLLCAYTAAGDVGIEVALPGVKEIPEQTIAAKVRALEALAPEVTALHLVTPRSQRMRFLAGQRLRVGIDGLVAELPVASCPCEERRIELHVCRDAADAFGLRARALKSNDEVTLVGPFGDFVLDDESTRPVVLIADGRGFAPIKSLLQHVLSLDHAPKVTLYWFAREGGRYQENLLRSYASALDHFRYVPLTLGDPAAGSLADSVARESGLGDTDVYVAGAASFVAAAQAALAAAGLPPERFKAEALA